MKQSSSNTTGAEALDEIIARNVKLVQDIEAAAHHKRSLGQVVSDSIAAFCGSTTFIWVHCAWFGGWLAWNSLALVPKSMRFDPNPFANLTLVVSLEAIFLSTFILISQNRQQKVNDERAHLDLQINMLAEQETSQMLRMLIEIRDHLGAASKDSQVDSEAVALEQPTDVRKVIQRLTESADPE